MRVALTLAVVVLGCKRDDREVIFAEPEAAVASKPVDAGGSLDAAEPTTKLRLCTSGAIQQITLVGDAPRGTPTPNRIHGIVVDDFDDAVEPMCKAMRDVDRCLVGVKLGPTRERLHFDVEIAKTGRVHAVTKSEPGGDPHLVTCLSSALRAAVFPPGIERDFCYLVSVPPDFAEVPMFPRGKRTDKPPTVLGALPALSVHRALLTVGDGLQACYERHLDAAPAAKGTSILEFAIDEHGAPDSVKVTGSLGDSALRACLGSVLRSSSFPEPSSGRVTVRYELTFAPRP